MSEHPTGGKMQLTDLLSSAELLSVEGPVYKTAGKPVYHSEKAEKNSIFFAIEGNRCDGSDFAEEALKKGARTLVVSQKAGQVKGIEGDNITIIRVADVRKALAQMSAEFYGRPSEKLLVIGVTGTKGKTSVTFMIRAIMEAAGIKTGIIGTVYNGYEGNMTEAEVTTPQSADIQELMKKMIDGGCKAVVMEVSSQGLMQHRVDAIDFDVGVFTNIFPDHIGDGEHKNFEEYLFWKSMLFQKCRFAAANLDDAFCEKILKDNSAEHMIYFGESSKADFRFSQVELTDDEGTPGIKYTMSSSPPCGDGQCHEINLKMPGRFNVYNSLAAAAVTRAIGIPQSIVEEALKKVKLPGRVEVVDTDSEFTILLDYAHNGRSLRKLMESLREYQPSRIILLFGCGGNRDRNRRFEMGKAALETADFIIVTSDNPRREEPAKIIDDITSVMKFCDKPVLAIPDRREAIARALSEGRKGDIIVIAGKGHETSQLIGDRKIHFDDREVIISLRKETK